MAAIRLIVGLGNPGPRYELTRHNVGANFVGYLARRFALSLSPDSKFKGLVSRGDLCGFDVRLLLPTTYMNDSGESVAPMSRFFKIEPEEILVAHDEMAFEPGLLRLKPGGGDNGHNGLRSIIACLGGQRGFHRLRIGVGHPGDREQVTPYLTSHTMPKQERTAVEQAWEFPDELLRALISGDMASAMNALHGPGED